MSLFILDTFTVPIHCTVQYIVFLFCANMSFFFLDLKKKILTVEKKKYLCMQYPLPSFFHIFLVSYVPESRVALDGDVGSRTSLPHQVTTN